MQKKELPRKRTSVYTEAVGVKVEVELKKRLESLNLQGIDVPELLRESIRDAAQRAEESLAS